MGTRILETNKDLEEVVKAAAAETRDPQALQRIRQEGDAFRREMRKKYGNRDIAVQLIQAARSGE